MELDDRALLAAAVEAGTAPLMHLSTLTESGGFSNELAHLALTDQALQDTLIDNLEAMLLRKGYRGLDVDFEYLPPEDAGAYAAFLARLTERLAPWTCRCWPPWPPRPPPTSRAPSTRATITPPSAPLSTGCFS